MVEAVGRVAPKIRSPRFGPLLLAGFVALCVACRGARAPAHAALRPGREVSAVAISPDGRVIVAGSVWGGLHAWEAHTRQAQHTLTRSSPSLVYSLAFSPDGRLLASGTPCGPLGCVQLWDATTGELVRAMEGHGRGVQAIGRDGQVDVLDLPGDAAAVRFSPDGRTLASAGSDGAIELWDVPTGQLVRAIDGYSAAPVESIGFSPDGQTLAASQGGVVLLWDVDTGDLARALEERTDLGPAVAFSPDGRTLASGGVDPIIRLWDARTGRLLQRLEQDAGISSLAFSPDGQALASGDRENRIWLWHLESGQLLRTYRGHRWDPFDNGVSDLAFSPDGRTLVSGGADGRVVLWDVPEE